MLKAVKKGAMYTDCTKDELLEIVRLQHDELAEAKRELVALSLELKQKTDGWHAELKTAQSELQRTNSELKQLTIELEDRVCQRTEELTAVNASLLEEIEERALAEETLRQVTQRLQMATRAAGLGIWEWNITTGEMIWDDEMYRLYGVDDPPSVDALELRETAIHPEDRDIVRKAVSDALRNNSDYAVEYRIIWPDDSEHYVSSIARVFRDAGSDEGRLLGIVCDITEKKRAESLRVARDAAETANRAKSTFIANMSHELRTPLNAVLGFSEFMAMDPDTPPKFRKNVEIINRSGRHLLEMINDILDIAKIEAGRTEISNREVDLPTLIQDLINMFRLRFEQKEVQLNCTISDNTPRVVMSDPGKIRQVLINLVGNALKFTEKGFVALRIDWENRDYGGCLLIDVEDSGCGIANEMQSAVFDPFVQAGEDEAKQKGTGLGLALVRNYVAMLDGEIFLESALDKGTTFHLAIPAKEALIAAADQDGITASLPVAVGDGQAVRALVVEDNVDNLLLLLQTLDQEGFDVRGAVNGYEGLETFVEWQPQIIFMDMRMPVMDGYEATRRIRALPQGESVIIIAVTASALSDEYDIIIKTGCDEVITKPFRREILLQAADRLLTPGRGG